MSDQQWRGVVRQLLAQGLLAATGEYGTLEMTDASAEVLSGGRAVMLRTEPDRPASRSSRGARSAPADLAVEHHGLFEALRAWRSAQAKEQGVP
ncbi:RQC domain-containing protein, partial [Rhizobium johnstonii]|uniref:RQC domain-containing protein n=1 Tax=Rhizobium johnstonii TaxID=3019933 RepID=UPI003F97C987